MNVSNVRQKDLKCWKGSQITNIKGLKFWMKRVSNAEKGLLKMSNLVTVKIPLKSQFLVNVSNLCYF